MSIDSLEGLIILTYGSQINFAKKILWNKNKVSRIFQGQPLSGKEIEEVAILLPIQKTAEKLNMKEEELFMKIFFPSMSLNGTNDK